MVLKDLYSVLHDRKEIPHGITYPKLQKDIQKFKQSNTDKNPIILFYFPPLVYATNEATPIDVLSGRRWGETLQQIKGFFDTLIAEDMKLVFFSEGYQTPKNEEKWLSHKTKSYLDECHIIEDIQKEADLSKYKSFQLGSALTVFRDYLEENLKSYGQWIKLFDMDVNYEMARYAKEKNVFAVFSDDIEFLIYAGNYRLYRVQNIRFNEMSTKEVNKFNFRKAVGLFPEHMPLFGTLCGNDIILEEKLKTFHNGFPEKARIKGIAKYVIKVKSRDAEVDTEKVSKRIGCTKEELEASLRKYEFVNKQAPIKSDDEGTLTQKLRSCGNSHIYALIKMQPLRLGPYYEDLRSPILDTPQLDLSLWLHRCLLGIAFKEKNDQDMTYPLYTIQDHDTGYERIEEIPEYPPLDLPPLETLMFDHKNDDSLKSIRLEILRWSLKCDKIDSLDEIPDIFVPIVLTLGFIVQEAKLNTEDADVILLSFYDTIHDKVPIIPEKQKTLKLYPFQLSYYYLRIQSLIIRLLSTIGLVKWSHYPEFNGPYFHHLHQLWQNLDEYAKNDRLSNIKSMRFYSKK